MDIKLKKYSFLLIKVITFIITITSLAGSVTLFAHLTKTYDNKILDALKAKKYYQSKMFADEAIELVKLFQKHIGPNDLGKVSHSEGSIIRDKLNKEKYKGILYNYYNVITNESSSLDPFKECPVYILVDWSGVKSYPNDISKYIDYNEWMKGNIDDIKSKYAYIYLGFTEEYIKPRMKMWQELRLDVLQQLYSFMALLGVAILGFIFLIIMSGRKSFKDKEIYLHGIDKMYSDSNILICIVLVIVWYLLTKNIYYSGYSLLIVQLTAIFLETFIIGTIGLLLVLSLVRHIKMKTLIKQMLVYTIYHQGNAERKITHIILVYSVILMLTLPIFPLTIAVAISLALKKVKDYTSIKKGLEAIKEGNFDSKIEIISKGEFKKIADDINNIKEGLALAIENKLVSERLKTELITNVSHDLRTPLTSIINYTDLLKKDNDSLNGERYINIIEKKSQQLKNLTDDLFEASKASSGNIAVQYEKIDIESLLTQVLGEMHECIEKRGYDIKINYPENKVYMRADGKLLWRIVDNILSNILKYALEGSRVYIDIESIDDNVYVCFKNISGYELNIPVGELMERFTRGDDSRHSEGSGLGLSIAKSLTELQKGQFYIEIDGDLFKATIQMPEHKP